MAAPGSGRPIRGAVMVTMGFDNREFNTALTELARSSRRIDTEVLIDQVRRLLRKLAWTTPRYEGKRKQAKKQKGRARAGWWPAWKALGVRGTPYVGNARLAGAREGGIIDGSKRPGFPFITIFNIVPYIEKLDKEASILESAVAGRLQDMTRLIERRYRQQMRRKSG